MSYLELGCSYAVFWIHIPLVSVCFTSQLCSFFFPVLFSNKTLLTTYCDLVVPILVALPSNISLVLSLFLQESKILIQDLDNHGFRTVVTFAFWVVPSKQSRINNSIFNQFLLNWPCLMELIHQQLYIQSLCMKCFAIMHMPKWTGTTA